jgi:hypothetical protein
MVKALFLSFFILTQSFAALASEPAILAPIDLF